MKFSNILKQLREEKNLSQKDIADYLGITRQAIASYELAKRKPDYETLNKLGDYFGVSVDYLLGRTSCWEINAFNVAKNIELIKGSRTYKELSEDIAAKTGTIIFPEMLETYAVGKKMPFVGIIKILANYAGVKDSFFYNRNTKETLESESESHRNELIKQVEYEEENKKYDGHIDFTSENIKYWMMDKKNLKYLNLAKEIQETGLPIESLRIMIDSFKEKSRQI